MSLEPVKIACFKLHSGPDRGGFQPHFPVLDSAKGQTL